MNKTVIFLGVIFISFISEAQNRASDKTVNEKIVRQADSLFSIGDYSNAVLMYKKVSGYKNSNFKIAKSYEHIGDNVLALKQYKTILAKSPEAILENFHFGQLLFKMFYIKKADSVFTKLTKAQPQNPTFLYHLARIKEKQKDSTALLLYKKTLQIDSGYINATYHTAKILLLKKQFKEAQQYVDIGLKKDSSSIKFWIFDGALHLYLDEYKQAIESYQKLIHLKKTDEFVYKNLAKAYQMNGDYEKAINNYKKLIGEFDDQKPEYHYNIALCYKSLLYLDKAEQHFKTAILLKDIKLDNEYIQLSHVYRKRKEYEKQIKTLEKAISENPKNEWAYYYLAVAADNYYKDKKTVLQYYKNYLMFFGETGKLRLRVKQRISDLKKEIHLKGSN